LKARTTGEETGTALHDVTETKGLAMISAILVKSDVTENKPVNKPAVERVFGKKGIKNGDKLP
jgi:hypothetical protein